MQLIDFTNSYMTFFGKGGDNIARIQLDAACTLWDRAGQAETYYLIAPCRSERMYRDDALFQMPNYEFCGIWSQEEFLLIRTHWASERDNREYGLNHGDRWDDCTLDIRMFADGTPLSDDRQIVRATLDNLHLIARTELRDEAQGLRAVLEYPIKTMNVLREPPRFQVDTGPVILPDFTSKAGRGIERFDLAHVVYNRFDKAEFVLRRPVQVKQGESALTTDYSLIQIVPAQNTIFSVAAGKGH